MKVLFIGNSHTYFNDLPQIFKEICEANSIPAEVTMLAHAGVTFGFHVKEPEVRFNIMYGNYDYVILQHRAHPMGEYDEMAEAAEELVKMIRQTGSRPVFYMTWSQKREGKEAQIEMSAAYKRLAGSLEAAVAPVGEAWWSFLGLWPDAGLYDTDGAHASRLGSLLAAGTIFSTICGRPPFAGAVFNEEAICTDILNHTSADKTEPFKMDLDSVIFSQVNAQKEEEQVLEQN